MTATTQPVIQGETARANARELVAKAKALGVTLAVKDGMIHPSGATSPEAKALLAQMRPLKQAIIDELAAALEFTLEDVEPLPTDPPALPPLPIASTLPPLPADKWLNGLPLADALAHWQALRSTHFCTLGHDASGYHVRCDPVRYAVQLLGF